MIAEVDADDQNGGASSCDYRASVIFEPVVSKCGRSIHKEVRGKEIQYDGVCVCLCVRERLMKEVKR